MTKCSMNPDLRTANTISSNSLAHNLCGLVCPLRSTDTENRTEINRRLLNPLKKGLKSQSSGGGIFPSDVATMFGISANKLEYITKLGIMSFDLDPEEVGHTGITMHEIRRTVKKRLLKAQAIQDLVYWEP